MRHLFCLQHHPDELKNDVWMSCLPFMLFWPQTIHKFGQIHMNTSNIVYFYFFTVQYSI